MQRVATFPHNHDGGEEFLVLKARFRTKPATSPQVLTFGIHRVPRTPGSGGCVILVKLWQFHPQDQERTVLDINQESLVVARGRPDPSVRLYSSK